ncbi:MAG: hypothetical protein JXR95_04625 [Deltaproteobacteria bacterium]|nr:hypothetical protein [Deltaproteobacteria bacterium]
MKNHTLFFVILLGSSGCYKKNTTETRYAPLPATIRIESLKTAGKPSSAALYHQYFNSLPGAAVPSSLASLIMEGSSSIRPQQNDLIEYLPGILNRTSISESWRIEFPRAVSVPVIFEYMLYTTSDGTLYAIDYIDRKIVFRMNISGCGSCRVTGGKTLKLMSRDKTQKEIIWKTLDPFSGREVPSPAISIPLKWGEYEIRQQKIPKQGCEVMVALKGKKIWTHRSTSCNWQLTNHSVIFIENEKILSRSIHNETEIIGIPKKSESTVFVAGGHLWVSEKDKISILNTKTLAQKSVSPLKGMKNLRSVEYTGKNVFIFQGEKVTSVGILNPDGLKIIKVSHFAVRRFFRLDGKLMGISSGGLVSFSETGAVSHFRLDENAVVLPAAGYAAVGISDFIFLIDKNFSILLARRVKTGNIIKLAAERQLIYAFTDNGIDIFDVSRGKNIFHSNRKNGFTHMFHIFHGRLFGKKQNTLEIFQTVDFRQIQTLHLKNHAIIKKTTELKDSVMGKNAVLRAHQLFPHDSFEKLFGKSEFGIFIRNSGSMAPEKCIQEAEGYYGILTALEKISEKCSLKKDVSSELKKAIHTYRWKMYKKSGVKNHSQKKISSDITELRKHLESLNQRFKIKLPIPQD